MQFVYAVHTCTCLWVHFLNLRAHPAVHSHGCERQEFIKTKSFNSRRGNAFACFFFALTCVAVVVMIRKTSSQIVPGVIGKRRFEMGSGVCVKLSVTNKVGMKNVSKKKGSNMLSCFISLFVHGAFFSCCIFMIFSLPNMFGTLAIVTAGR